MNAPSGPVAPGVVVLGARELPVPLGLLVGFAIALATVAVSAGVTLDAVEKQAALRLAVADAYEQGLSLQSFLSTVKDAETHSRGYLLTNDEVFASAFVRARLQAESELQRVERLPLVLQADRGGELHRVATAKLEIMKQTVDLQQQGDHAGALRLVGTGRGRTLMEDLRSAIERIASRQSTAVIALEERWVEARERTTRVAFGGACVLAVLIAVAAFITLREIRQRDLESWVRNAELGLAAAAMKEPQLERVGNTLLAFVAGYVGAHVGAFYGGLGGAFSVRGVWGVSKDAAAEHAVDDGLAKEAISSKRVVVVEDVPAGFFAVKSGTGRASAGGIIVAPTVVDGEVNGVVELGFLRRVSERERSLLERLAPQMAAVLRTAEFRLRVQRLLEETQKQAEELQTQQEELRVSNEELEEQSRALRDSQARLQNQQAELEQINEELHTQAATLTAQKEQLERAGDAVIEKNAELERSSQYKSDFLANMSHELRTPLNSALILARLLADNKEGNLNEEQVRFAETIYSSGNDLLELINDVLDLSKIEAGHVEVRPSSVSLQGLFGSLTRTFEPVARQKGLAFKVSADDGMPPVIETDHQRLEQILKNLLSNACKFTDAGSVALRAFVVDDARVGFAVTDTGVGIPKDKHAFVFEAFRQIDGGSARKHGGTGLGLSISRDLAQLLGGELKLESVPGRGSTFTLIVPRSVSGSTTLRAPTPLSPPSPATTTPTMTTTTTKKKPQQKPKQTSPSVPQARTILIVEDDAAFAAVMADVARGLDFEPVVVAEAEAGWNYALTQQPAAVVLDVRLPDHSGLSVLDRLKRNALTRHIPVHVVSGVDHARAALEMGAVGYALKPVDTDGLRDALLKLKDAASPRVKRVLIIEDDDVQRESVRALLGVDGVEVTGAATAAEARQHLSTATWDCVVMDLSLPDASGHQLLEDMASGENGLSFPPVIVYTGKALSDDDEARLRRYSQSIIVKGARSPERLLDEVTLFLHQVESELPPERQRMLRAGRDREQVFEGRRLLVVEDDVRNIFAVTRVLEPKGATIEIARNGREALERLQQSPRIDLVLMDVMMPEMDGLEATRRIRTDLKLHVPILMLTAKAMKDDQERCLAAGANDYIAKPIIIDQLISLIRVWMPK